MKLSKLKSSLFFLFSFLFKLVNCDQKEKLSSENSHEKNGRSIKCEESDGFKTWWKKQYWITDVHSHCCCSFLTIADLAKRSSTTKYTILQINKHIENMNDFMRDSFFCYITVYHSCFIPFHFPVAPRTLVRHGPWHCRISYAWVIQ